MERPALAAVDIPKNSREIIRIEPSDFLGMDLVNIRVWYRGKDDGRHKPTRKGVCFVREQPPCVIAALEGLLRHEEDSERASSARPAAQGDGPAGKRGPGLAVAWGGAAKAASPSRSCRSSDGVSLPSERDTDRSPEENGVLPQDKKPVKGGRCPMGGGSTMNSTISPVARPPAKAARASPRKIPGDFRTGTDDDAVKHARKLSRCNARESPISKTGLWHPMEGER